MMISLDGKSTGEYFGVKEAGASGAFYDEMTKRLAPKAWGCGRTTFIDNYSDDIASSIDLTSFSKEAGFAGDFILEDKEHSFAFCFDRKGRVPWIHNIIEYPENSFERIVEVVTEEVDPRYLAYLRSLSIPYLVAGKKDLDIPLFLQKIKTEFGIAEFALCGGAHLNGSFFKEGMVDEISLVLAPVLEGSPESLPFVMAPEGESLLKAFTFKEVQTLPDGGLWIRYSKK